MFEPNGKTPIATIAQGQDITSRKKAEETLDKGIMYLAFYSINGIKDNEQIEGVRKEVWYERFWNATERYIWPTRSDYEENWKM